MQIESIGAMPAMNDALVRGPKQASFAEALGSAADTMTAALTRADALASAVAAGKADIAEAAIARAKADVMLEVAAIAASRISGAITTLLQTQV
ncbi:MAG TPA: flagellar hook-basal body complex protein FliE [Candidatus Acidoferrales bacterium]|nr:flagellar hook-basal body complex protein FliE [Candidatus Acidoferrales bacterium]